MRTKVALAARTLASAAFYKEKASALDDYANTAILPGGKNPTADVGMQYIMCPLGLMRDPLFVVIKNNADVCFSFVPGSKQAISKFLTKADSGIFGLNKNAIRMELEMKRRVKVSKMRKGYMKAYSEDSLIVDDNISVSQLLYSSANFDMWAPDATDEFRGHIMRNFKDVADRITSMGRQFLYALTELPIGDGPKSFNTALATWGNPERLNMVSFLLGLASVLRPDLGNEEQASPAGILAAMYWSNLRSLGDKGFARFNETQVDELFLVSPPNLSASYQSMYGAAACLPTDKGFTLLTSAGASGKQSVRWYLWEAVKSSGDKEEIIRVLNELYNRGDDIFNKAPDELLTGFCRSQLNPKAKEHAPFLQSAGGWAADFNEFVKMIASFRSNVCKVVDQALLVAPGATEHVLFDGPAEGALNVDLRDVGQRYLANTRSAYDRHLLSAIQARGIRRAQVSEEVASALQGGREAQIRRLVADLSSALTSSASSVQPSNAQSDAD